MITLFACFVSALSWILKPHETLPFKANRREGSLCHVWIYKATRLLYLSNLMNSNDKAVSGLSLLFIIVSAHQTQKGEQSFRGFTKNRGKMDTLLSSGFSLCTVKTVSGQNEVWLCHCYSYWRYYIDILNLQTAHSSAVGVGGGINGISGEIADCNPLA